MTDICDPVTGATQAHPAAGGVPHRHAPGRPGDSGFKGRAQARGQHAPAARVPAFRPVRQTCDQLKQLQFTAAAARPRRVTETIN
jgi:hypothetical protein